MHRLELRTPGVPFGATNAYLLGRSPRLLVDPAARSDELDAAVAERSVGHLAVTHAHPDHVGAVAHYAAETGATAWARAGYADRFERATGVTPDRTYREGTAIGHTGVTVIDTPGHAPDHVAFARGNVLVSGDLAFAEGSAAVGASDGDMRAYLTSLRRIRALAPAALRPGHGPPVEAPRDRLAALIAHRLDRERRVLAAVEAGADTVDAAVDAAYDADLSGVRDLAADAVRAHLAKLAVEGRVRWHPDEDAVEPA